MNNIGTVLSALPPVNRTRVADAFGFARLVPERKKPLPREGNDGGSTNDFDIEAVDSVVEGLFRAALEVDGAHRWALNNLGLHLHRRSRNEEV